MKYLNMATEAFNVNCQTCSNNPQHQHNSPELENKQKVILCFRRVTKVMSVTIRSQTSLYRNINGSLRIICNKIFPLLIRMQSPETCVTFENLIVLIYMKLYRYTIFGFCKFQKYLRQKRILGY